MIPLQTASRHPVAHIVFSPDGAAVAVAQMHSGVTVLERATGRTIAVCAMPRRATLTDIAFCADGKYLAAAHAKGLEVFDANTGAPVFQNFHYPWAYRLAVRGDLVLGAPLEDYTALRPVLKVRAPVAAPESRKSVLFRGQLPFVACAPDGSHVLSADRNRLVLLNVASDRTVAEVELPASEPAPERVAQFCPLGRRFAVNDGKTLDVYDASGLADEGEEDDQQAAPPLVQRANGTQTAFALLGAESRASLVGQSRSDAAPMPHTLLAPMFTLKPARGGASGWYPPFALAADGRGLIVKRPRNRVQWWDAPTGTLVNEWSWRFEWVTCVAVSPDGLTAVAGGRFGRVLLWDLE